MSRVKSKDTKIEVEFRKRLWWLGFRYSKYWVAKIERNRERDTEVSRHYAEKGWKAIRVWEHDFKDEDLMAKIAKRIKG
jgi:G:T-mismatch repair DNA endonuclease (very short patch repair protein)